MEIKKMQILRIIVLSIVLNVTLVAPMCQDSNCQCAHNIIQCHCNNTESFPQNTNADLSDLPKTITQFIVKNCSHVLLKTRFFKHTNIDTISISNNGMVAVQPLAFAEAHQLYQIHISKSAVDIPAFSFANIILRNIIFERVNIDAINVHSFHNTTILTYLVVTDSKITRIHRAFNDTKCNTLIIKNSEITNAGWEIVDWAHRYAFQFLEITNITVLDSVFINVTRATFAFQYIPDIRASLTIKNTKFEYIENYAISLVSNFTNPYVSVKTALDYFEFSGNTIGEQSPMAYFFDLNRFLIPSFKMENNTILKINGYDGFFKPHDASNWRKWHHDYNQIRGSKIRCDSNLCWGLTNSFPKIHSGQWSNFERLVFNEAKCLYSRYHNYKRPIDLYKQFMDPNECYATMSKWEKP